MALVNHETKEVQFKIVYCGPSGAGKTTNLQYIHGRIDDDRRGDLLSMATSTDRTRFFDYLPIDAVLIRGYHTKFQLYTVPGSLAFEATRQLVLKGADGIVFVVDGARPPEESKAALDALKVSLEMNGVNWRELPWCTQLNKADHPPGAIPLGQYPALLGVEDLPFCEAVASRGFNVFHTLNLAAEEALQRFHASIEKTHVS